MFILFARIAFTIPVAGDAANNALQAQDLLHGHLMLHGWILADVTFYTFELPLIAATEFLLGLSTVAVHVALALVYLIVVACAVAIAVTDGRGASRPARAAVVVAILAAPFLVRSNQWIPLGLPDHTGTTVFLLLCALLVDRAAGRRFTPPLLCVILCAGQLGDATVRYVGVPAIVAVCAYRVAAARSVRTGDAWNLLAAAASVPLALGVHAAMRHAGAYLMITPKTQVAPTSEWGHNAALAWHAIRMLYGAAARPVASPPGAVAIFGVICMLVAAGGLLRVLYRWRTARRAEQVLLLAMAANIGLYIVSTLPGPDSPHDIVTVLPCGAVLGARALIPGRITSRARSVAVTAVVAAAALVPLAVTAAQPVTYTSRSQLAGWLRAHGLRYGLSGYWDASPVTLLAGNQVQIRAIRTRGTELARKPWDSDTAWYSPAEHDANFVVLDPDISRRAAVRVFGRPASTHHVGIWQILIYHHNLLRQLAPPRIPPTA